MKKEIAGYQVPVWIILCGALLFAQSDRTKTAIAPTDQSIRTAGDNGPDHAAMTINNLLLFVDRNAESPLKSTSGIAGDYPKGTAGIIYMEGLLWGARVRDGKKLPIIRVNGSTYATGLKAGKVLYDAGGNVYGSEDQTTRHVWRVRRDYLTAELTEDAAYSYTIPIESVTAAEVQEVADQYDYDWQNWPAGEGAPYEDVDGNGSYDPAVDIPGWPGAAQTIWLVANDLPYVDPITGDTIDVSTRLAGSPAIGMELQVTMWAYQFGSNHPFNNTIFKRARMIYTGLPETPDTARLDSMYLVQWSDPDLGTYTDDYVGCDIDLSLGYVYNANSTDATYLGDFGLPVPAAGYQLLQGPIVNGDTLGMTSFGYYEPGPISDPSIGYYGGTLEWWNCMEGFLPQPAYPAQYPWTDPTTGELTKYPLSGDPVTGSGWIDGIIYPPGDRRMYQVTGPVTMALGDTQEVVIALSGAMGTDNISSLVELKKSAHVIRESYNGGLVLAGFSADVEFASQDSSEITIIVETVTSVTGVTAVVSALSGGELASVPLYDDGLHGDQEAGDFIFGGRETLTKTAAPLSVGFSITDGIDNYVFSDFSRVTIDGPLTVQGLAVGADFLNGDGAINPGEIVHLSLTLLNEGEFAHTGLAANVRFTGPVADEGESYQYLPVAEPGVPVGGTYDAANPDTYSELFVSESAQDGDEVTAHIVLTDDLDNVWEATLPFQVAPYEEPLATPIQAVHSAGPADASVTVKVIDFYELTGDDYEVYFDRQHYYRDLDGTWKETNYPDSVGKSLHKAMDVSASKVTGAAIVSGTIGTIDLVFTLDFVSATGEWADGFKLDLPDDLEVLDTDISGAYGSYDGQGLGQNCVNFPDGLYDAATNSLTWGDSARSEFGCIEGDVVFTVNVALFDLPITVGYKVYDDGYGTTIVDASGTVTLTELGYQFKTENHWNLRNLTTSSVLYEDMAEMGTFNNGSTSEGFVVKVAGSYDRLLDFESYTAVDVNGSSTAGDYRIEGYSAPGWAPSARCREPDVFGVGTDDLSLLDKDIQLRFTGVYDDPVVDGNQTLHPIKPGTGSIATFIGSRDLIDPEDHPMANDVSTERNNDGQFLIRIPFEVWDVESDPPQQINFLVYDRVQHPVESLDFYAFNPIGRMYCYIRHTPYDSTHIAEIGTPESPGGADDDSLTWCLIFWETNWASGDTITIYYNCPIQQGVDLFTFTTFGLELDPDSDTPESFHLSQNYPNPFNLKTTFEYDLPTATDMVLVVYDILGREVIRLVDAPEDAGPHQVIWTGKDKSGRDLASGVYIYRMVTPRFSRAKKLLLLK